MNSEMRRTRISKVVLSSGATDTNLEKSAKLLEIIGEMKPQIIKAGPRKRIPSFGVRPGLPLGTRITLRDEKALKILKKLLGAIDNRLNKKQVNDNHFSFGIKEYIEIPGIEYVREIGIRGFNVTVVFEKPGLRVKKKKIKKGKFPKRQEVLKDEIIKFMRENFNTEFV